jgi:AraC-like DNA-binding protein
LKQRVNKFLKEYKKQLFHYKDGVYLFPYLGNSPRAIVESTSNMGISRNENERNSILVDNNFFGGKFYFNEIEKGFWIFLSDLSFKTNLAFKAIYDDRLRYDYYELNLHFNPVKLKSKTNLMNGFRLDNNSWALFKPKAIEYNSHFKGSRSMNISVSFTKSWLKKNLYKNKTFLQSNLKKFLESDAQYVLKTDTKDLKNSHYRELETLMADNLNGVNDTKIKTIAQALFLQFMQCYDSSNMAIDGIDLPAIDRKRIQSAEKILLNHLHKNFPGIEQVANEIGVSSTKLKTDFKKIFGQSVFQYYRDKQLLLSMELLSQSKIKIKDVADKVGYENVSKFSAAFKRKFGFLPSSIK